MQFLLRKKMKIYYHRIEGFHGLDTIKGIERYGKRAAALCNSEDILLLDNYPNIKLPIEEISLLNDAGLGPKPENIFAVDFTSNKSWEENLANNNEVLSKILAMKPDTLMPFTGKSPIIHHLVKYFNVTYPFSNQEMSYWGENKATLIELGKKFSHIPDGFFCKNKDDFSKAWKQLAKKDNFTGKAVVKPLQGASGLLSSVIETEEMMIDFIEQYKLSDLGGGILQEWFTFTLSPSINYWVHENKIEELFISDQIFEDIPLSYGKVGTCIHRGNVSPSNLSKDLLQKLRDNVKPVVQYFHDKGYRGPIGFDTILTNDNKILIIEANPRVTGPHYGYFAAKNKNLEAFRLSNETIKKGTTPEALRNHLGDLFLTKDKNKGYFIYNFSDGKFTGVAVGKSRAEIDQVYVDVQKKLQDLHN